MARPHVMTPARRAALRKAQLASAAKRRHVTVYHYTSPRKARKIVGQQRFKTARFAPGNVKGNVYVTKRRSNFYKNEFRPLGRKSAVVTTRVAARHVSADPNDVWFRPLASKTSKHKPARAYMVPTKHIHGSRIKHL